MILLIFSAVTSFFTMFGAGNSDWVCKHQEWTAQHMNGELGWSLEKGRDVAARNCRVGVREEQKASEEQPRLYWAE